MMNDKFRIHLISGDGMGRNQQGEEDPKKPAQPLKYAISYFVVAAILIVANRGGKNSVADASQSRSPFDVRIELSLVRKAEGSSTASNTAGGAKYDVRFRLTNQGTQPIFYPVSRGTDRPIGDIVFRVAPQPDWKPLPESDLPLSLQSQANDKGRVAWIEMPPGGWADGEYEDPGFPAGNHAFAVKVKFADGKISRLVSRAYSIKTD